MSFLILQRLTELWISGKNEKWLLQNGAVEYGKKHYLFIVLLHILFFISLIVEYYSNETHSINLFILVLFFLLIGLKIWVISSLGKYWNTKIFRISGTSLIRKGPYLYLKHPNYMIVVAEIFVIPLIFHLYCTAIIFSVLNALMLSIRIREENRALGN